MATATRPTVLLELSPEEARALVILISCAVKGNSDPITDALFSIAEALFVAGINYDSVPSYVTYDIEKNGKTDSYKSYENLKDDSGISFRNAPEDALTRQPDDTY